MHTTNRSLEGLRGAAALLVVFFHMGLLSRFSGLISNGYLAVDLFFVLSGFVICSAYSEHLKTFNDVWRFFVRRIGRLWPLHIAGAIAFYLAVGMPRIIAGMIPDMPTAAEALSIVTMTQGLIPFGHDVGNPASWSTTNEFYVYLLFAAICMFARSRMRLVFASAAAIAMAVVLYVDVPVCAHTGNCMALFSFTGFARCIAGFFVGAVVALSRDRLSSLSTSAIQIVMVVATPIFIAITAEIPVTAFAAPVVFAVLIASIITDRGPAAAMLQTRPMQYLGKISYALYLSHAVFVLPLGGWLAHGNYSIEYQLTGGAAFLFASFALTHFMHKYVEIPFRDRIYAWSDSSRHDHYLAASR